MNTSLAELAAQPNIALELLRLVDSHDGPVYDIQVEVDESFALPCGLVAHNCPLCVRIAAEARSVPLGGSFAIVGNNPEYANLRMPPIHPHCCLPVTPVIAPLGVAGIVAHYDGPVVRLRFSDGSEVAVSPNHMLLTPTGFATASSLMEGDDVIRCLDPERPTGGDPDDNRQPTTIEQIVHSWAKPRGVPSRRVPVAPEYLHGDAALCEGDIHVVPAHGSLADEIDPVAPKPPGDLSFFRAARKPLPLDREGRLAELLFALRDATDGGVGPLRERKARLRAHAREADQVRLASAPALDSRLDQSGLDDGPGDPHRSGDTQFGLTILVTPNHLGQVEFDPSFLANRISGTRLDSGLSQPRIDGHVGDSEGIRDVAMRFPGQVATCQVVGSVLDHYCGPVYDIETETSLYLIGNGIASSNCRCSVSYILADESAPDVPAFVPKPRVETSPEPEAEKPRPAPKPRKPRPKPEPQPLNPEAFAEAKLQRALKIAGRARVRARITEGVAESGAYATYDKIFEVIDLYRGAPYWSIPGADLREFRDGTFSSPSEDATIHHEIGHALHHRALGYAAYSDPGLRKPLPWDKAELMRARVSRYAARSAVEAVAEIYSGLKGGLKYDEEVMDFYRSLEGPMP